MKILIDQKALKHVVTRHARHSFEPWHRVLGSRASDLRRNYCRGGFAAIGDTTRQVLRDAIRQQVAQSLQHPLYVSFEESSKNAQPKRHWQSTHKYVTPAAMKVVARVVDEDRARLLSATIPRNQYDWQDAATELLHRYCRVKKKAGFVVPHPDRTFDRTQQLEYGPRHVLERSVRLHSIENFGLDASGPCPAESHCFPEWPAADVKKIERRTVYSVQAKYDPKLKGGLD